LRDRNADNDSQTGDLGKSGSGLEERLYALQDPNWNVAAISDTTGSIQERYTYHAYGKPSVLTGAFAARGSSTYAWETVYAGYRRAPETAQYHVRNRDLQCLLGRWDRRDPRGYRAGDMSVRRYVTGRAPNTVDPSGLTIIMPPPPPRTEYFGCCGLDITKCLARLYARIEQLFALSEAAGDGVSKHSCETLDNPVLGWDTTELAFPHGAFSDGSCGTCPKTVTVNGKCYKSEEVNYYLWGLGNRLCFDAGYGDGERHSLAWTLRKVTFYRTVRYGGEGLDGRIAWTSLGWVGVLSAPPATVQRLHGWKCGTCNRKYKGRLSAHFGVGKHPWFPWLKKQNIAYVISDCGGV